MTITIELHGCSLRIRRGAQPVQRTVAAVTQTDVAAEVRSALLRLEARDTECDADVMRWFSRGAQSAYSDVLRLLEG